MMHVTADGKLDFPALINSVRHATRMGMRQACIELDLPDWNDTNVRDRLIGPGPSGWEDAMDALGFNRTQANVLKQQLRATVHDAIDEYAQELGMNRPLLATTV